MDAPTHSSNSTQGDEQTFNQTDHVNTDRWDQLFPTGGGSSNFFQSRLAQIAYMIGLLI